MLPPRLRPAAGPAEPQTAARRRSRRSPSAPRSTTSRSTPACSTPRAASCPASTGGDFQVFEDGKPQKVVGVLAREHPGRARSSGRCSRRRRSSPTSQDNLSGHDGRVYVMVLDDLHTHAAARAAHQGGGPPVRRSATSAPTTRPRSSSPAAARTRRRSSPTASGGCWRRSTSSWAASCARRRSSGSTRKRARAASASRAIAIDDMLDPERG